MYCYQILTKINQILSISQFVDAMGGQKNQVCDPSNKMASRNMHDAKEECKRNPSCHIFYDVCGYGNEFRYCKDTASVKLSSCGSVLFRHGNLLAICPI